MDAINRAVASITDLFKSLSMGSRITAGLLLVMVVVSLAYLFQSQGSAADTYLMGGEPFSASHLPQMEAAFAAAGLTSYEVVGNRIRVPRGQQSLYMGALADEGALPPDYGKYLEKAISSDTPWLSRAKQQEMLRVAKQNELQLILSRMKGIESASVLYDERKPTGFNQAPVSTASVSVKPTGTLPLDEERIPMIRHVVASAFAGLKPESVSVTDLNGRTFPGGGGTGALGSVPDDPYIARKKVHELMWAQKIRDQLEYIPGVVVSTNVELTLDTEFDEQRTVLDPKGVVYQSRESGSSKTTEAMGPAGRPGVVANQAGGANQPGAVGAGGGSSMSEETNQVEMQTAVPTTIVHRKQQGLTPERVKVAVAIPTNYYAKVWSDRNPTPPGQDPPPADAAALAEIERQVKEDVKNAVVTLLPVTNAADDPFPQVTVTSFQHLAREVPPPPGIEDHALAWLGQYWTTLGMGGLALVSLVLLRSLVRSSAAPAPLPTAPVERPLHGGLSLVAEDEPEVERSVSPEPDSSSRGKLKRRAVTNNPSLREELAGMVKDDPDSAVAVLRNWIGTGA